MDQIAKYYNTSRSCDLNQCNNNNLSLPSWETYLKQCTYDCITTSIVTSLSVPRSLPQGATCHEGTLPLNQQCPPRGRHYCVTRLLKREVSEESVSAAVVRPLLDLELVVGASVVKVVTQTSDQQREALKVIEKRLHLAFLKRHTQQMRAG